MADFSKLLDHPEHQKIIDKLLSGETPKEVSQYLKLKYDKPDENHLRLSASLLSEFQSKWMDAGDFISNLVKDEKSGKLDKQIAKSLLNNESWKERIEKLADDEIDIKKKIVQLNHVLEARAEQIFDKIQENPGSTKLDYVLTKYFELYMNLIEKIDKIVNGTPDQRIEHTYTVQMVEDHSIAFQEAIKRVLQRLDPEMTSIFMDTLYEEMEKMRPAPTLTKQSIKARANETNNLLEKFDAFDGEIEDVLDEKKNDAQDSFVNEDE